MFFSKYLNTVNDVGDNQGKVIFAGYTLTGGTSTIPVTDAGGALPASFLSMFLNRKFDPNYMGVVVPNRYIFLQDSMISIDFTLIVRSSVSNRTLFFGSAPIDKSLMYVARNLNSSPTPVTTGTQQFAGLQNAYPFFVPQGFEFIVTCDSNTIGNFIFTDQPAGNIMSDNWLTIRIHEKISNLL